MTITDSSEPVLMTTINSPNPPEHMCEGSYGPSAESVVSCLVRWADASGVSHTVARRDKYGPEAVALMKIFQGRHGLASTGDCDLATRAKMREIGLPLELLAVKILKKEGWCSVFVDLDGNELLWRPLADADQVAA